MQRMGIEGRRAGARREFPFWLLAAALLAVFFLWMMVANGDYLMILNALRHGIVVTLWVTVVACWLAMALGLAVGAARMSRWRVLREVSTFYVEIVRGIPVLVLLFYVAFVGAPGMVATWNWLFAG